MSGREAACIGGQVPCFCCCRTPRSLAAPHMFGSRAEFKLLIAARIMLHHESPWPPHGPRTCTSLAACDAAWPVRTKR